MFQLGSVLLQVSNDRQDVDNKKSSDGTDLTKDATYLGVEDRDHSGDEQVNEVNNHELALRHFLVFENQLEYK